MQDMSVGEAHPPPEMITSGKISMLIRKVARIPLLVGFPTSADDRREIDPAFVDQISKEVNEIYGREIAPIPSASPKDGSVWTVRSLTQYLVEQLNAQNGT